MSTSRGQLFRTRAALGIWCARYTRIVHWKRAIGVLVLAILTGLPVSATTCALLCEPDASRAEPPHHGSDANCSQATPVSPGDQLVGWSQHDCRTHNPVVDQLAILVVDRSTVGHPPRVDADRRLLFSPAWPTVRSPLDDRSPTSLSPPGSAPLVRRI